MNLANLAPDGVEVEAPTAANPTSNPDISSSNDDIGDYMKVLSGRVLVCNDLLSFFTGQLHDCSFIAFVDFDGYDEEKNLEELNSQV